MATQTQAKTRKPFGSSITGYLQEVTQESRKVNWPKRKEVVSNTTLTLLASLAISLFIFFSDQIISSVLAFIYG